MATNQLTSVATLQGTMTGILHNAQPQISSKIANYKFNNFPSFPAQRGPTVYFQKPPPVRPRPVYPTVGMGYDQYIQDTQALTVNKPWTTTFSLSGLEQTFYDVKSLVANHLRVAALALGTEMAKDVNTTIEQNTYRFYNPGINYTANGAVINTISSQAVYQRMISAFRTYGAVLDKTIFLCDEFTSSELCSQALSLFTLNRNDDIAGKWELPMQNGSSLFQSNILKQHVSGDIGNAVVSGAPILLEVNQVLTAADGGVSQITFNSLTGGSFPVSATGARASDVFQFVDNVTGFPNLRYFTHGYGYTPSGAPVQCNVTQDAASTSTAITLNFTPALYFDDITVPGMNKLKVNINAKIVPGMRAQLMPSHTVGCVMSGQPIYIAAPKIPNDWNVYAKNMNIQTNVSANEMNLETGVSILLQAGGTFPDPTLAHVATIQYGIAGIPEQMMRVLLPYTLG
jgi:hypothetical protein